MNSSRIYRNTVILTALRFLDPLIAFGVTVAISRRLGPEVFGSYAVLIATVRVTMVIGQLGIGTLLVREVAKRPQHANSYLSAALVIAGVSSTVVTIGLILAAPLLRLPLEAERLLPLACVAVFPLVIVACYEAVFTGFEKMELILFRSLAAGAIRALMMVGVVFFSGRLMNLILIELLTAILSALVCVGVFRRCRTEQVWLPLKPELKRFTIGALPFFGTSVVTVIASRADVFMLTRYRSVVDVALYVAAYRFFELAMVLPQSYIRSSFPQLSMLTSAHVSKLRTFNERLLRDMRLYVAGAAAGLIGFGALAILVAFGEKFSESIYALQLLAMGLLPWGLGRICSNTLLANNLQKYDFLAGLVATLSNVAVLFLLVPTYGIVGAAFAALVSLTVGCLLLLFFTWRTLGFEVIGRGIKWYAASAAGCACLALLTGPNSLLRFAFSAVLLAPLGITVALEFPVFIASRRAAKRGTPVVENRDTVRPEQTDAEP